MVRRHSLTHSLASYSNVSTTLNGFDGSDHPVIEYKSDIESQPITEAIHVQNIVEALHNTAYVPLDIIECPNNKPPVLSIVSTECLNTTVAATEYYRSPTGYDWASSIDDEEEFLVPAYYTSPIREDWATLNKEPYVEEVPETTSEPRSCLLKEKELRIPTTPTSLSSTLGGEDYIQTLNAFKHPSPQLFALDLNDFLDKHHHRCIYNNWREQAISGEFVRALDLKVADARVTSCTRCGFTLRPKDLPGYDSLHKPLEKDTDTSDSEHDGGSFITDAITEVGSVINSLLPNLRQYVPADTTAAFEENLAQLDPKDRETIAGRQYAQGVVDWQWMCEASKQLLISGQWRRTRLEKADRSLDWFWINDYDSGRKATSCYPPMEPLVPLMAPQSISLRPIHHINFAGQPVRERTYTSPAISFWAAMSEGLEKRTHHNGSLLRSVTSWNAGKTLDPFIGPEVVPKMRGSKLKEWATGAVDIVYQTYGTWMDDEIELDDDRRIADGPCVHSGCEDINYPPLPYIIDPCDGDTVVNDDCRAHSVQSSKTKKCIGLPSKLSCVVNIDDGHAEDLVPQSDCIDNPYTVRLDRSAALFTGTGPKSLSIRLLRHMKLSLQKSLSAKMFSHPCRKRLSLPPSKRQID